MSSERETTTLSIPGVDPTPLKLPLEEEFDENRIQRKDIPNVPGGFTLSHVLTDTECHNIIDEVFADSQMTHAAPVLWRGWSQDDEEVRRLGQRVIRRSHSDARILFDRVRRWLPESFTEHDDVKGEIEWRVHGLSERFRLVRYDAGMCFPPHFDGAENLDHQTRSFLSIVFYLDKCGGLFSLDKDFRGGELLFLEGDMNDLERKTKVIQKLLPGLSSSSLFLISLS